MQDAPDMASSPGYPVIIPNVGQGLFGRHMFIQIVGFEDEKFR